MTNTKDTTMNEELRQSRCSILLEEVKERVKMLKDYGMSEKEIISRLHDAQSLVPLIVSKSYKIYLGEERNEVHLEPIVKSLYLLFLQHPEGIIFKDLPDYRQELASIYNKVRPWGLTDRAMQSIEDVTNPMLNSINEKCAKIKKVFERMLDSSIAEHYYIQGTRGKVKRITLPRDLVTRE